MSDKHVRRALSLYNYGGVDEIKKLSDSVGAICLELLGEEVEKLNSESMEKLAGEMVGRIMQYVVEKDKKGDSASEYMVQGLKGIKVENELESDSGEVIKIDNKFAEKNVEGVSRSGARKYVNKVVEGVGMLFSIFEVSQEYLGEFGVEF